MNWRWLVPIWGIRVAMEDYVANYANDYMERKMLPILIYHLFIISLPLSIFIVML